MKTKCYYQILLLMFAFVPLIIPHSVIANSESVPREAGAGQVWIKGQVNQVRTGGKYLTLMIDTVFYKVMDEKEIYLLSQSDSGAFYEKTLPASAIVTGNSVMAKVHGNRIFRLMVLK